MLLGHTTTMLKISSHLCMMYSFVYLSASSLFSSVSCPAFLCLYIHCISNIYRVQLVLVCSVFWSRRSYYSNSLSVLCFAELCTLCQVCLYLPCSEFAPVCVYQPTLYFRRSISHMCVCVHVCMRVWVRASVCMPAYVCVFKPALFCACVCLWLLQVRRSPEQHLSQALG